MQRNLKSVTIKGIAFDPESQLPVVLLHDTDNSFVIPITVGPFEASAVIVFLEGIQPKRPLTHDLMHNFFVKHQFKINYLEIYQFQNGRYNARVVYSKRMKKYTIEVRPSDGIALALRANAQIMVKTHLIKSISADTDLLQNLNLMDTEYLYLENTEPCQHLM